MSEETCPRLMECTRCQAGVQRLTSLMDTVEVCDPCLTRLARAGIIAGILRGNPPESSGYQLSALVERLDKLLEIPPPSGER